jgi:hypothetical protein
MVRGWRGTRGKESCRLSEYRRSLQQANPTPHWESGAEREELEREAAEATAAASSKQCERELQSLQSLQNLHEPEPGREWHPGGVGDAGEEQMIGPPEGIGASISQCRRSHVARNAAGKEL